MDVSLITSLYRTDDHIAEYVQHALSVAKDVAQAGIQVEFVLIANDASPFEREEIARLQAQYAHVQVQYVPRESLYASWNRGVRVANGEVIGFWNVDDVRTVDGIVRGVEAIRNGCKLAYFAHKVLRLNPQSERVYHAIPYHAENHRKKFKCGPFFLFHRDLYAEIGAFDERFRIVGDYDWCVRATYRADFCPVPVIAGTFYLHGGNLSDTGDPNQLAETNVMFLKHGLDAYVIPVEPNVMRTIWERWGDAHCPISDAMKARLWGTGAEERWRVWQTQEARRKTMEAWQLRLRYIPKRIVDGLNLRPLLARLGLVKARKTVKYD